MKGLAKGHICIIHGHRQERGEGQREEGRGWEEGVKRGKGDNCECQQ